jgi:hypothetical protein
MKNQSTTARQARIIMMHGLTLVLAFFFILGSTGFSLAAGASGYITSYKENRQEGPKKSANKWIADRTTVIKDAVAIIQGGYTSRITVRLYDHVLKPAERSMLFKTLPVMLHANEHDAGSYGAPYVTHFTIYFLVGKDFGSLANAHQVSLGTGDSGKLQPSMVIKNYRLAGDALSLSLKNFYEDDRYHWAHEWDVRINTTALRIK